MDDRPLTDEERRVLDHAVAVVRNASTRLLESKPSKVDCAQIRCHPGDEQAIRALYDAPIVVDPRQAPGTIVVVPLAYAKRISVEIGFAQPPAGAGREHG